ncbi:MAG: hypothetical protein N3A63_07910 [Bacteroidetes bacterium]|nr:hypothetical protein [Bacteroidota bacterium]
MSEVEILVQENHRDVAFVGVSVLTEFPIYVLRYSFGKAHELEWVSFVYVFGYPAGQCLVTKGIM